MKAIVTTRTMQMNMMCCCCSLMPMDKSMICFRVCIT